MEERMTPHPTRSEVNRDDVSYLRRFQLLRYRDVTRLCDVMETIVPIHGTGNFPTLEIRPSRLVQLVRERLLSIGIKVRDIRLNGSAATHVLSDNVSHTYKDLDLIFAIDFPSIDSNLAPPFERGRHKSADEFSSSSSSPRMGREERTEFARTKPRPTSLPSNARRRVSQLPEKEDVNDDPYTVEDSGYTSSGSSVVSVPISPSSSSTPFVLRKNKKKLVRSRTRSVESVSSTSSLPQPSISKPTPKEFSASNFQNYPHHHSWQEIKDATMEILLDFLPSGVSRSKMNSVVLGSAYVQKMVKVTNESDKWSLISLKNNSGRNLELKFVQNMKRQFEFSVDSFQIILDTYLEFRSAAQSDRTLLISDGFHPTVVAESVYGDFGTALRHLHNRRICTHRPEEIRGGGLLRYCNLIVRDFKPGESPEPDDVETVPTASENDVAFQVNSSEPEEIAKLERHMCSRFFIDFNDIGRQRNKLISYLDNHFAGEEELKFQYLLVLRKVVDASTVCLMQHERTMILDLITMLMRQTLANNVAKSSADAAAMRHRIHMDFCNASRKYFAESCLHPPCQCHHPFLPVSDRASPASTYSSLSAPTPCESSTSPSPLSLSRPQTPCGSFPGWPSQYKDSYCGSLPVCENAELHHPGYCRQPCSVGPSGQTYYPYAVSSSYLPSHQYTLNSVQPIFFNPNKVACFYQPAGFTHQSPPV